MASEFFPSCSTWVGKCFKHVPRVIVRALHIHKYVTRGESVPQSTKRPASGLLHRRDTERMGDRPTHWSCEILDGSRAHD